MVNLETLTNAQLIQLAQKEYGLKLSNSLNKAELIKQIEIAQSPESVDTDTPIKAVNNKDQEIADLKAQINELKQLVQGRVINTSKNIYQPEMPSDHDLTKSLNVEREKFLKEKKVKVSIPTAYAKHMGNMIPIKINGSRIDIPANSQEFDVPESFANHIKMMLQGYDITVFNVPDKDIKKV